MLSISRVESVYFKIVEQTFTMKKRRSRLSEWMTSFNLLMAKSVKFSKPNLLTLLVASKF